MKKIEYPVMDTILVDIENVYANDYNPNIVAKPELNLLKISIEQNGFCFPVVVIEDEKGKYCIVDGFHRYTVMKDMLKQDKLPVVILKQTIEDRMTATVQFNRARGTHQILDMTKIVLDLIKEGVSDLDIQKKLGMEADELFRLKQMSGLKEAFKDKDFSNSWEEFERKFSE